MNGALYHRGSSCRGNCQGARVIIQLISRRCHLVSPIPFMVSIQQVAPNLSELLDHDCQYHSFSVACNVLKLNPFAAEPAMSIRTDTCSQQALWSFINSQISSYQVPSSYFHMETVKVTTTAHLQSSKQCIKEADDIHIDASLATRESDNPLQRKKCPLLNSYFALRYSIQEFCIASLFSSIPSLRHGRD